jgi:Asp-tRNA(Asn)/Glu-tRNA(Gln) amidotransferase A subunit family amidase
MGFNVDLLTATAVELQTRLTSGSITSVELVEAGYRQINQYDGYLKAVIETAPGALKRAKYLDEQRSAGKVLGPLHGIPVLIKVYIYIYSRRTGLQILRVWTRTTLQPILSSGWIQQQGLGPL